MANRRYISDYKAPEAGKKNTPEEDRAQMSKDRGAFAATIKNPQQRRDYINQQGQSEEFERRNSGKADDAPSDKPELPAYKDGTARVPKTGPAVLHEGEAVLNKDDADEYRDNMADHNVSLYRAMHHLNKGGLHRALGVPEGENIPKDKLAKAKNSKNEHVAKMAHMAETMSHFKKG